MTHALMATTIGQAILYVAAHTIAEFYRGGRRSAGEARLLNLWRPEVLSIGADEGRLAGELLATTGGSNSMDALVVAAAAIHGITEIFTTDPDDLIALRDARPAAPTKIAITDVQ